jgi:peptidoglycan/LPS O-acetylase OafA/YrhL
VSPATLASLPEAAALPRAKPSLTYAPALDGLRALCVAVVILYHADLAWMPGGFLGVEVFFVLSGYLITSLLLSELAATARINLVEFWMRRARRLLPALWLLLGVVSLFAAGFLPGQLWRLRYEVLASFAYVANWYFSFAHYSYFEVVGRPSLLAHLWSLAIEEQFYLFWPLLLGLAAKRLSLGKLGLASLVLAAVSVAWMAARFVPGVDPSALYYDSVARAAAILLGATLAFWAGARIPTWPGFLVDGLGWCGLLGLLAACGWYGEADAFVFRGGLVAVDLCALAVIVASVHPQARSLQRLLAFEPLRLIGTRSYGLYLWHWPVAAVTRPGVDVPLTVPQTLLLRIVLSGILAELSYRFLEMPVRRRRFWARLRAHWQEAKSHQPSWARRIALAVGCAAVASSMAFVAQAFVLARPPAAPSFEPLEVPVASSQAPAAGTPSSTFLTAAADAKRAARSGAPASAPGRGGSPTPEPTALLLGDSVVRGAARYLRAGHEAGVEIDTDIGRTSSTAVPHLRKLKQAGKLRRVVIVHLGNNGWLFEAHVHEIIALLAGVERVVFINAHVPRRWQEHNNATLAAVVAQYPRLVLLDWAKASEHHREWFGVDGLHLTHVGAQAFAALVTPYYSPAPRQ